MSTPGEFEARLTAVETDLGIKVETNRTAINALGVQTAAGFTEMRTKFDQVDAKFEQVDRHFAEMRGRFDQTAAGMDRIVELLTRRDDQ